MKPQYKPQYQVHKTEKFIRKIQELKSQYHRVLELLQSVEWHLERKPHYFTTVSGDYYLLKTEQLSNSEFPQVKILYVVNETDNIVTLLDIDD